MHPLSSPLNPHDKVEIAKELRLMMMRDIRYVVLDATKEAAGPLK